MDFKRVVGMGASLALMLSIQVPAFAQPSLVPQTLVIGVDHVDSANQQPDNHRVFEYTDFFTRSVTVHSGDTVDFQAAPGSFHIVALAADEAVARQVYPVAFADSQDPNLAIGTGEPKVVFGPSNQSITGGSTTGGGTLGGNPGGPPVCGVPALGQSPCTFSGGPDVESAGPNPGFDATGAPAAADWLIQINAAPGKYHFFCYIHPGMHGNLNVVGPNQPTTTQAQVDAASATQFAADQAEALATEQAANNIRFTGGGPGTRTYTVQVGVGTLDRHVAISEMLPTAPLHLVSGDTVRYLWSDPHNIHTVGFPALDPTLPPAQGFDCGDIFSTDFPPCIDPVVGVSETIGDPGNAAPGSSLTDPHSVIDAGLRVGSGYGVTPSSQSWSTAVSSITKPGAYQYQCTIHFWMQGTLAVQAPPTSK